MARKTTKRPGASKPGKGSSPNKAAAKQQLVAVSQNTSARISSTPKTHSMVRDVHAACSMSDPFCGHANGAKYLAESTSRTLAYQNHFRYTLSTNASGSATTIMTPGYNVFAAYGTVTGSSAAYTTYIATGGVITAAAYRIVSWGCKLRKISAPLTSSGMVRIRGFGDKDGVNLATVDIATYNCDSFEDLPLSECRDVCIIGRRTDITHQTMRTPDSTNPGPNVANWVSPGWNTYVVSVDGGPASTGVLDLEFYVNYEVTFFDNSTNAQLCTPPRAPNPVAVVAANAVYTASSGIFKAGVQSAAKWIERTAASAIATYFGGPAAGAVVARIVD